MASNSPRRVGEESLNDSWVVFSQEGGDGNGGHRPLSIHNGNMEKLLMEAQRESRSTSRGSSQGGSPKSPHSPVGSGANSAPGSTYSNGSDRSQGTTAKAQGTMAIAVGAVGYFEARVHVSRWRRLPLFYQALALLWVMGQSGYGIGLAGLNPSLQKFRFKHPDHTRLSIRKSKAMKSNFLSAEVLSVFIPSLILTNLLTLGIGIYIGLRVISPRSS